MEFRKDLSLAPKDLPQGQVVLALLPGDAVPSFLRWEDHTAEIQELTGEPGFWNYHEDLISDVTGGVREDELADAVWCVMDIAPFASA